MNEKKNELQMSEAFLTSIFLAVSGGFQDAYTYNTREEVFSNAQTGNVVLMSQHFMCGEWMAGLRYLFPILFFAFSLISLYSFSFVRSLFISSFSLSFVKSFSSIMIPAFASLKLLAL